MSALPGPYPINGNLANVVPAPPQPDTFACMQGQKRWLVWAADKQPFYPNGKPRSRLDTESDWNLLGTYEDAQFAVQMSNGKFEGIGFALGPDGTGGHWQGIDLDKIKANQLSDIADNSPGYVELSPSENGIHTIGYGRHFETLGPNSTGTEAYAASRYFTVTENPIRNSKLVCIADFVEQIVAPRHSKRPVQTATTEMRVHNQTLLPR